MKIINANYQFINESDINKKIERIARICYKSEEKIAEGTDVKMIQSLVKRNHLAMLEHASLAFIVDAATYHLMNNAVTNIEQLIIKVAGKEADKCYLRFTQCAIPVTDVMSKSRFIISGNMRAWIETLRLLKDMSCIPPVLYNALMENAPVIMKAANISDIICSVAESYDYKPFDEGFFANVVTYFGELSPEERMIHEDMSVLFTVDRGITHELVRHRDASFAQESTRYCNYSLDKHGQEIIFIKPCFFENLTEQYSAWTYACEVAEQMYFNLLAMNATPQQARDVLPSSVKSEIVVTANLREWKHIFELRACDSTGAAHPQMKEVMIPCLKYLRDGKYNFAFNGMVASDEVNK